MISRDYGHVPGTMYANWTYANIWAYQWLGRDARIAISSFPALNLGIKFMKWNRRAMLEWVERNIIHTDLVDRERDIVLKRCTSIREGIISFLLLWKGKRIPVCGVREPLEGPETPRPVIWRIRVGAGLFYGDDWYTPDELEQELLKNPNVTSQLATKIYRFDTVEELEETEALVRELFMFYGYSPPRKDAVPSRFTKEIYFYAQDEWPDSRPGT